MEMMMMMMMMMMIMMRKRWKEHDGMGQDKWPKIAWNCEPTW
jgi:hypothetical protein